MRNGHNSGEAMLVSYLRFLYIYILYSEDVTPAVIDHCQQLGLPLHIPMSLFKRKSHQGPINPNQGHGHSNLIGNGVAGGSHPYQQQNVYGQQPPPVQYNNNNHYGHQPPQPPPRAARRPPPGADPRLWQFFTSVDTDESGAIDVHELQRALINANWSSM